MTVYVYITSPHAEDLQNNQWWQGGQGDKGKYDKGQKKNKSTSRVINDDREDKDEGDNNKDDKDKGDKDTGNKYRGNKVENDNFPPYSAAWRASSGSARGRAAVCRSPEISICSRRRRLMTWHIANISYISYILVMYYTHVET